MADARRRLRALEDFCTQVETGSEALPEFFHLLRTYVDSDHAAYFHADRHGRICGAYHEVAHHTPQATEFIERARTGTDACRTDDPPSVAQLFRMHVPVQLLRFDTPRAAESAFFRDIIHPIGGRHVLRVGLRARERPLGIMALVRGRTARSFTDNEFARVARAARPLKRLVDRRAADDEHLLESEGFLFVSGDRIEQGSEEGFRLWHLLEDRRFLPRVDGRAVLERLLARPPAHDTHERRDTVPTGWGDFELVLVPLQGLPDDARARRRADVGNERCLLRIRHWVLARIRYLQHMEATRLSPMEKLVCMDLLRGRTQTEIAGEHGVGVQTIITHVRGVYAKTGVAGREELKARFRARPADATALAAPTRRR